MRPLRKIQVCTAFALSGVLLLTVRQTAFTDLSLPTPLQDEWIAKSPESHASPSKLIKLKGPNDHKRIRNATLRLGPNGEPGYIHDPTYLHKQPRPFQIDKNNEHDEVICKPGGTGPEQELGYKAFQKLRWNLVNSTRIVQEERPPIKVFCAIYTYDGAVPATNAIQETWGKRCDGFLLASTVTNLTTGHVHMPHQSMHEGKYKGMWQKVRTILAYLYDNFLDDYDYFHICGDDTFIILENLKYFLTSPKVINFEKDPNNLLFAGFWTKSLPDMKFHQDGAYYLWGGSGYTMSKYALKAFVERALSTCSVSVDGSAEDVLISACFRVFLNVTGFDTRDDHGVHRYHNLPIERHATFPKQKWGYSTQFLRRTIMFLQQEYGFPVIWGVDSISNYSVAFHKLPPAMIRRYEYLLYGTGTEQCVQNK